MFFVQTIQIPVSLTIGVQNVRLCCRWSSIFYLPSVLNYFTERRQEVTPPVACTRRARVEVSDDDDEDDDDNRVGVGAAA